MNTSTIQTQTTLFLKIALILGAIAFSILHPLAVSLLSVGYFFISNLTVEEAAILKQKAKDNVSKAVGIVMERKEAPLLSSSIEEAEEVPLLPHTTDSISTSIKPTVDLPTKYKLLFGETTKFPKTKSCFTKQYNAGLVDVIALWDMKQREQFLIDFAALVSKKTKQRILELNSTGNVKTPIVFPSKAKVLNC